MNSLATFSRKKNPARIAALLFAALIALGASAPTASAADALTTTATRAVRKNVLGSLFRKRTRVVDNDPATRLTAMDRVNRSILGLPLSILKLLGKGVTKAASKTVTDHIRHY